MTTFNNKGNLGGSPTLKRVLHNGREIVVAEMRVFFGRYKPTDNGFEQVGGYWLPVSLYDDKAEAAAKLLRKGARVRVTGELREFIGKAEDGTERELFQVAAEDVSLILTRVESVAFKPRAPVDEPAEAA